MVTFRNSSTCFASGAPPVTISRTLPPRRCLIFENTSASKIGAACAQEAQSASRCELDLTHTARSAGRREGTDTDRQTDRQMHKHLLVRDALVDVVQLSLEAPVEEKGLEAAGLVDFGHDAGVDAVEDARHAHKQRRAQSTNVIDQALDVAAPVADAGAQEQEQLLGGPGGERTRCRNRSRSARLLATHEDRQSRG
jgi:hypothetical protein